jgi:hypothetical protein
VPAVPKFKKTAKLKGAFCVPRLFLNKVNRITQVGVNACGLQIQPNRGRDWNGAITRGDAAKYLFRYAMRICYKTFNAR